MLCRSSVNANKGLSFIRSGLSSHEKRFKPRACCCTLIREARMTRAWLASLATVVACGGGDSSPGGGGSSTVSPDVEAVERWKVTMTIADFHTANMSQTWSTMLTTDGKLCTSCHTE